MAINRELGQRCERKLSSPGGDWSYLRHQDGEDSSLPGVAAALGPLFVFAVSRRVCKNE